MRNNSNRNKPKSSARLPAVRQGAAANTSLAERRERAVIRLPEERRKGTKYQVIRGQYLRQANKKENPDSTNADAIKKVAVKQEEKQKKAKRQTMAAKNVNDEKEKKKTSSEKDVLHENNDTNAVSEAKDEYAKSTKADEYAERLKTNIELSKAINVPPPVALDNEAKDKYARTTKAQEYAEHLQTNIELNKAVNIPPPVTWEQVIDHSVKKDSVYSQSDSARERALQYKGKADFYLNKMKRNTETGQKEVNPDRDKDVGRLYKKAYKLANKEELLGQENSTLFDKGLSVIQLKSEVDNALNKDNTGEAVAAAAAIPFTHAATKVVRKLADKSNAVNAGKTGFELAVKVTSEVAASDSVGEATANAVVAVPKYVVEKKVEKTVRQVMQDQHDRKIAAQKERLRKQQEKVEKRAQDMKKEHMQRKMKTELYKSEHGITSNGNNILRNAKAAIKNALESMKRAISAIRSSGTLLMAAAGGTLVPVLSVGLVVIIVILMVIFPFFYLSGDNGEIEDSPIKDTITHYYEVMDKVVNEFNATIPLAGTIPDEYNNSGVVNSALYAQYESAYKSYQTQYEAYNTDYESYVAEYGTTLPPTEPEKDYWYSEEELSASGRERGPICMGYKWADCTDGTSVPKGNLYDEMLCSISTYNAKRMARPDSFPEEEPSEDESTTPPPESEPTESESTSSDIILMSDETVAAEYSGAEFWTYSEWEEWVDCPSGGNCCTKTVTVAHYDDEGNPLGTTQEQEAYCPGHFYIMMCLKFDFDLDKVWEKYCFDDEDKEVYEETKKQYDKEKTS